MRKFGKSGKGSTTYLSANICEEFIALLGKKVLSAIVSEILQSKYYSISVNFKPDVSHVDQLTFTVRYIKGLDIVERFLEFIPIHGHGSEHRAEVVIQFLTDKGIPIADCHGQSYGNASNMSGCYTGLQARIKEINEFAEYRPCAGHSLNLVGVAAASCCQPAVSYFGFVNRLYTFVAASTNRSAVLVSSLPPRTSIVKRLADTSWSAHSDAIKSLYQGCEDIQIALDI